MNSSRKYRVLTKGCALAAAALALVTASAAIAAPPPPGTQPASVSGAQVMPGGPGTPPPHRPSFPPPHRLPPPSGEVSAQERAAHEKAAHAEGGEEGPPKPVNWTDGSDKEQPPYLAAALNFAVLAIIYVYFGKKPIAEALKARKAEVSKQIEEAQKIKHEAEARSLQYTSKLKDLGQELETTKAALVAAGVGEKMRIVREAEEKATRMQKDAEFLLEQERKQVRMDLQREAVQAALVAAEALLRGKLTMADQERVAEEFLATLVPAKAGSVTSGSSTGGAA
jgi:F-type H+-transporting ATPase subunit b